MIKQKIAICYDFDGTLAKGNLQECSFIPEIGTSKEAFWSKVKEVAKKENADEILVYMKEMIEAARKKEIPITKDTITKHGKEAKLFDGLKDGIWFKRINKHAEDRDICLEHYIISSGVEEMIRGCDISNYFKEIFASKFLYDENNVPEWPGVAINYTNKTQFLFRINKGFLLHNQNEELNTYMKESERPIPFENMIFIGDGDTDIPTMKMLSYKGGHSIAVYDPEKDSSSLNKIHRLISEDRVNFVAPADYKENSQVEIIVKGIVGRIARKHGYKGNA